jgi:hypothetical protein
MTFREIHDATARLAIKYGVSTETVSVTVHAERWGQGAQLNFRCMAGGWFSTGDSAEQALDDLQKRLEWWKRQEEARQSNRPQTDAERRLELLGDVA